MPERSATLYRMKLTTHECPFGLLARRMLEDAGYEIDEHLLISRDEVEEFKAKQGLATTPVILIDGQRIDGSEQLADYLETADQV
jgi:glutaredoxin 3